jgi:hypothetical protein
MWAEFTNHSMTSDLKPYPVMKDSGVPWLGPVPAHWDRRPGRACYREKRIPNTGLVETTVLSLSYGRIVVKPADRLHGLVPESFETYQIVEPGDIIIRPTDLQNDWNSLRFDRGPFGRALGGHFDQLWQTRVRRATTAVAGPKIGRPPNATDHRGPVW